MSDIAIRVDGLGKRYRIGARQARYRTLRETVTDLAAAPFRRLADRRPKTGDPRSPVSRLPSSVPRPPSANHIWTQRGVPFGAKRAELLAAVSSVAPRTTQHAVQPVLERDSGVTAGATTRSQEKASVWFPPSRLGS